MAVPPPDFEPPPWLKFFRRYIWVIMGLLAIITITLLRPYMRHIPDPPEVMFTLPDYAMVDHEGRPFTPETLKGEVWIAGFVFTRGQGGGDGAGGRCCGVAVAWAAALRARIIGCSIPVAAACQRGRGDRWD